MIFSAIAMIVISALCAKFKMPNVIFLLMITIFGIFMYKYLPWYFTLIMFAITLAIFVPIKYLINR